MKNLSIIILLLAFPLIAFSQNGGVEKLFNKYKNTDGFELEMSDDNIDMDIDGNSDLMKFLDNIENIYVLNFDKATGKQSSLKAFKSKLDKLIDKNNFISVLDLSGEDEFKMLITKDKTDKAVEMLIITTDEEDASFIYITN